MDEVEKWYLHETELTISNTQTLVNYNLESIEDAQALVDKLNNYESYTKNLARYMVEKQDNYKSKINVIEEFSQYKTEAIDTMQKVYELRNKADDFNTQIIALIKLDCIKEIRQQYELIKLREDGE